MYYHHPGEGANFTPFRGPRSPALVATELDSVKVVEISSPAGQIKTRHQNAPEL